MPGSALGRPQIGGIDIVSVMYVLSNTKSRLLEHCTKVNRGDIILLHGTRYIAMLPTVFRSFQRLCIPKYKKSYNIISLNGDEKF